MASASKKLALTRGIDGVLWWRFWNAMAKTGGPATWDYLQGPVSGPVPDHEWEAAFDGTPIETLWTQDQNEDSYHAQVMCKEKYGSKIITDIDDWYDDIPEMNPAHQIFRKHKLDKKLVRMHDLADTICCSTPFLVDKMGPKAKLCPNFVVEENWRFPKRPTKKDEECVLFFGAGIGRAKEIHDIREALTKFLEEPNTKIVLMGAWHEFASQFPPGKVVWARFITCTDYTKIVRWIAPDITISPMEHRDFNIAKSNIKWLESAMVDACFVGERWGDMERTIEDGVTGHLADGVDEWTEKLVELARNPELRSQTSQNAKAVVKSDWTWDGVGHLWRDALGV